MEKDENGYPIGRVEHSDKIHRQIAWREIYLKNRKKYPKKFSEYVVHHINTNKEDFSVRNLYICTKEEHNAIHEEQKKNLKKFKSKKELDEFLKKWNNKRQKKLDYEKNSSKNSYTPKKAYQRPKIIETKNSKKRLSLKKVGVIIFLVILFSLVFYFLFQIKYKNEYTYETLSFSEMSNICNNYCNGDAIEKFYFMEDLFVTCYDESGRGCLNSDCGVLIGEGKNNNLDKNVLGCFVDVNNLYKGSFDSSFFKKELLLEKEAK